MRWLWVVMLAACVPPKTASERGATDFATYLKSLGPTGYWRLGEKTGPTLHDESANHVNGQYLSGVTNLPGALQNDPDLAKRFTPQTQYPASSLPMAEIPDRAFYSLTQAWDGFNRITPMGLTWGNANAGGMWRSLVTQKARYATAGGVAIIDPDGDAGTFHQGLNVQLADGDLQVKAKWSEHAAGGALQPVALTARETSVNDFIRAELREQPDHGLDLVVMETIHGADTILATQRVGTYEIGDWWYVRLQFIGQDVRARSWHQGDNEPTSWLAGTAVTTRAGEIGIRSANSVSTTRPTVAFEGFWAMFPGLTIHAFVNVEERQVADEVLPLSKGDHGEGALDGGNREYYFRYERKDRTLKAYVFSLAGGYGAGHAIHDVVPGNWYEVVFELDSGDALDLEAGTAMYVDGVLLGSHTPGSLYNTLYNSCCKPDEEHGGDFLCWAIYPFSGDSKLHLGRDGSSYGAFNGSLDEVAIFPRKLTANEILNLHLLARPLHPPPDAAPKRNTTVVE